MLFVKVIIVYYYVLLTDYIFSCFRRAKIKRPSAADNGTLVITGRSILNAAQKVGDSKGIEYSDSSHSVYLVTGMARMKLTPFAKNLSSVNITNNKAIVESDVIEKQFCVESAEFIVLANDSPASLQHKCVGGNFSKSSQVADHSKALLVTAVELQSVEVKKTLETIAKGIFTGQPRAFIRILLSSEPKLSAADLLSDAYYGTVKLFISSIGNDCNMTEVKDVTTAGIIICKHMNSITTDTWKTFLASKSITTLPTNSSSSSNSSSNSLFVEGSVVSPLLPQIAANSVWLFLGNLECPVYQVVNHDKIVCIDIKDFSAYTIRNIDLQLQLKHNSHDVGAVFRVDRFSKEEGNLEYGKYLNGKFPGSSNTDKVSHLKFLIQEEASPEN